MNTLAGSDQHTEAPEADEPYASSLSGSRPDEVARIRAALAGAPRPPDLWEPGSPGRLVWDDKDSRYVTWLVDPDTGAPERDGDGCPVRAGWEPQAPRPRRSMVRIADVRTEPVLWLWKDRIPLGKLTVIDGDPGQGKSTMTLDLASRITRGLAMPDGSTGPGAASVLVLSAEDDPADTIRPRLQAAGADLARVHVLTEVDGRLPSFPQDLQVLEEEVSLVGAVLVVVDPLMAFLGGDVNGHRDQDVRRALAPLAMMAQRTGAAVVLVRHLNKQSGGSAMYRGGGSIGITGAARSVLLVAPDPDADPEDPMPRRIVAVVKSNLAPTAPSMAYRLVTDDTSGVEVGRVAWDQEPTGHLAADLLAIPERAGSRSARDEAEDFLGDLLVGGPVPMLEVKAAAEAHGLSWSTIRRAQGSMGVRAQKVGKPGERGQRWDWSLPEDAQETRRRSTPEGEHLRPQVSAFGPTDERLGPHEVAVLRDEPVFCPDCRTLHRPSRLDLCHPAGEQPPDEPDREEEPPEPWDDAPTWEAEDPGPVEPEPTDDEPIDEDWDD